jgi:hypothetical protein
MDLQITFSTSSKMFKLRLIELLPGHRETAIITPVLKELHWLPVHIRVEYELFTYVFKAFHGQAPTYIRNIQDIYTPSRQLSSKNDCLALVVPRSRTVTYGDRA